MAHLQERSVILAAATASKSFFESIEFAATVLAGFFESFTYRRDPGDAHYGNVALAADAKLIVSRDKDLLYPMDATKPDASDFQKRFPAFCILNPVQFLREVGA